jgi:6-pyruvoyltetrahydropterin/6-carboxytetrahydropterin synthase
MSEFTTGIPNYQTVTRKLTFSAGHRLLNHEGACRHLHGHNYQAWVTCRASKLDEIGRVIDFGVIKNKVGTWLDNNWDHGWIVYDQDQAMLDTLEYFSELQRQKGFQSTKVFMLPTNPTAENMAYYLFVVANQLLSKYNVAVTQIKLWETENSYATVR